MVTEKDNLAKLLDDSKSTYDDTIKKLNYSKEELKDVMAYHVKYEKDIVLKFNELEANKNLALAQLQKKIENLVISFKG